MNPKKELLWSLRVSTNKSKISSITATQAARKANAKFGFLGPYLWRQYKYRA